MNGRSCCLPLIGPSGEPGIQLVQEKAPELALALAEGMGREVAFAGPAGDRADLDAEELGGAFRGEDLPVGGLGAISGCGGGQLRGIQRSLASPVGRLLPAQVTAAHLRARPVGRGRAGGTGDEPFPVH